MLSRAFHLFWLMFVVLWFAAIAPGHTRGIIKLGGPDACCAPALASKAKAAAAAAVVVDSCCVRPAEVDVQDDPCSEGDKPVDPASCCAICYFNATLQITQPIQLTLLPADVIALLKSATPIVMQAEHHFEALSRRGPPGII